MDVVCVVAGEVAAGALDGKGVDGVVAGAGGRGVVGAGLLLFSTQHLIDPSEHVTLSST